MSSVQNLTIGQLQLEFEPSMARISCGPERIERKMGHSGRAGADGRPVGVLRE
jgi:hypothetical protein